MKKGRKYVLATVLMMFAAVIVLSSCSTKENIQTDSTENSQTVTTVQNTEPTVTPSPTPSPSAHVHEWNDWQTIKQPTCTENGLMVHICNCGQNETQEVRATGHSIATKSAISPTCTDGGLTEGTYCTVCNVTIQAQQVINPLGHNIVETEGYAATCTKDGCTTQKKCSRCGKVIEKGETIPAKGHTVVIDNAVAATETTTGLTEGSHCSVCGQIIKAQEVISKKESNNTSKDVRVTGVSLSSMSETLEVGGVTILAASVLPADATNKIVNWTSSDWNVAVVSSGLVTAVGSGNAVITATTEDGQMTANCLITVKETANTEQNTQNEQNSNGLGFSAKNYVLYNDNGIKVTLKECKYNDYGNFVFYTLIENNSNYNLSVFTKDESVNGYMIEFHISNCDVSSGKKTNAEYSIYSNSLEKNGISNIAEVEFKLWFVNQDDWGKSFYSDTIKITKNSLSNSLETKSEEKNNDDNSQSNNNNSTDKIKIENEKQLIEYLIANGTYSDDQYCISYYVEKLGLCRIIYIPENGIHIEQSYSSGNDSHYLVDLYLQQNQKTYTWDFRWFYHEMDLIGNGYIDINIPILNDTNGKLLKIYDNNSKSRNPEIYSEPFFSQAKTAMATALIYANNYFEIHNVDFNLSSLYNISVDLKSKN